MRAVESVALRWLHDGGLTVPATRTVTDEASLASAAARIGPPWVLKPDTAVSGKGLSGQVFVCDDPADLTRALRTLETDATRPAILAEYVEGSECYLSIALDPEPGGAVLRVSATGGVGFDASTATALPVAMDRGLPGFEIARALRGVGDVGLRRALTRAAEAMWRAFSVSEAALIEVNPFRWDGKRLVAVGVAVDFEDHCHWLAGHYRPSPLVADDVATGRTPNPREEAVTRANADAPDRPAVRFYELDGDVAMLVIGGGAGLLTLDRMVDLGLAPSCYVDASPGAPRAKFVEMLAAGLGKPGLRGGVIGAVVMSLMDTQELAHAIVDALGRVDYDPAVRPLVVRLAGPHEEESRALLAAAAPEVVVMGRELSLDDACNELARRLEARP